MSTTAFKASFVPEQEVSGSSNPGDQRNELFGPFKSLYTEELDRLFRQLEYTEKILQSAPSQNLWVRVNGKYRSYYCGDSEKEIYLHKKDVRLPALILKYCASNLRNVLRKQLYLLETSPALYDPDLIEIKLLEFEEKFGKLTPAAFSSNKTFLAEWDSTPYKKNPYFDPNQKLYKTKKGDLVRSKLEMIIADILFDLGIHYRYDAGVKLKDGRYRYPDFTIINPYTRKLYYLEVCGKMNDSAYVTDQVKKIHEYAEIGIVVGNDLLLVFEDDRTPFDPDDFKKMLSATVLKRRF